MVPFNDKKKGCKVAQFQLGYKGYIQLAERTGYYKKINVLAIKEGELVKYDPLNEEIEVNMIEDDEIRENAPTVGYFAMFEYMNGFRKTMYWTKKKMLAHADRYSQAFDKESYKKILEGKIPQDDMWKYSSYWYKDFDGMAFKTMLRQLISKWGIMSIDMQKAYESDMATIQDDGQPYYIENDQEQVEEPKADIVVEQQEQPENVVEEKPKRPRKTTKVVEEQKAEISTFTTDEDIENEFFN